MAAIGEAEAKKIASCKDLEGRCVLAHLLGLPYQDEVNLDKTIQVDFFYDNLRFAADKGFPWEQVSSVVQFAVEFLATATDQRTFEAVQLFQAMSPNLLEALGERNYKVYTQFLFSTFFCHFQLYKYVLAHPRSQNVPGMSIDVYPPVPTPSLSEAQELSVWRYEQTQESLQQEEVELVRKRLHHQEDDDNQPFTRKDTLSSRVDTSQAPFTKESLEEMMRDLLSEFAAAAAQVMSNNIHDVQQDLAIKLEKTCVPRPATMGPPHRYKPKSPIQPLSKAGAPPAMNKKNKSNNALEKPKSPKSPKSPARSRTSSSRASKR